jgi:hypothetical protein
LFNGREIFVTADTRRNGNDVFRTKDFCRYTVKLNPLRFARGFFGQSIGGKKPNREIFDEQMFALNSPPWWCTRNTASAWARSG